MTPPVLTHHSSILNDIWDAVTHLLRIEVITRAVAARVSGSVAAPAAGAVIADTGALAAGSYRIEFSLAAMDTVAVGKGMIVEYRNAANNATTNQLGGGVAGVASSGLVDRLTVAASERVRVIAGPVAGAASSQYVAHIAAYPVT